MFGEMKLNELLDEFASKSATPGGGSASALSGALGAGLVCMVANLTVGKKGYEDVEKEMGEVLEKSEVLRGKLASLIEEDSNAFDEVMAAFKLPKETEEDKAKRRQAVQDATKKAALVPLEVMKCSREALELARAAALRGNKNSVSDCGVAALELWAGVKGAELNCLINLSAIKDDDFNERVGAEMDEVKAGMEEALQEILDIVAKRMS